ncbi:hypothetical protein P9112_000711 [Eukaryota sp. TZLM1-RC]
MAPNHDLIDYYPIKKNFYIQSRELSSLSPSQVEELRVQMDNIRITGPQSSIKSRGDEVAPCPIISWYQSGLPQRLLDLLSLLDFKHPTPIQSQSIPIISSGYDMVGIAKTGSGKTLAFLLPLLRHLLMQPPLRRGDGPKGLILAPTRELAMQTFSEAKRFGSVLDLRSVCLYGGSHVSEQIADLRRGCDIIIATPGRLIDMLTVNNGTVTNLFRVSIVVIDEADRMFDLGFEPQIKKILECTRPDRQLVMFSATFPRPMEALAKSTLNKPIRVIIGGRSRVCGEIQQVVYIVPRVEKFDKLVEILRESTGKSLIFVERQDSSGLLFKELVSAGFSSGVLHGTMDQNDRDSTIIDFKNGVFSVLIATSIAARGLDVKDLNLVVNYDAPNHLEDYVHRVGRTGRAGRKGKAVTFLQPDEARFAPDLVRALRETGEEIPSLLIEMAQNFLKKVKEKQEKGRKFGGFGGQGFKFDEKEASEQEKMRKFQRLQAGIEVEESDEEVETIDKEKVIAQIGSKPKKSTEVKIDDVDETLSVKDRIARVRQAASEASKLSAMADVAAGKTGYYTEDFDINSYPQRVRKMITNKDVVESLCTYCNVQIVVRGTHVPPGKEKLGQRGLHLAIESTEIGNIEMAKREIMRRLREEESQMTFLEVRQSQKSNVI